MNLAPATVSLLPLPVPQAVAAPAKKPSIPLPPGCRQNTLSFGFFILFVFAFIFNGFATVSLPWLSGVQTYIVQTNFNQNTFNGSLNGIVDVQNMTRLRLGIWAGCYNDLHNSGTCLKSAAAYQIIITKDNASYTIVQPLWTGLLITQAFAALLTLITIVFGFSLNYWLTGFAVLCTLLAMAADYVLFTVVKNATQTFGGGVTTNLGPGFALSVMAFFLLSGGCCWQLGKSCKAKDKAEEEEKQKKKDKILGLRNGASQMKLERPHWIEDDD